MAQIREIQFVHWGSLRPDVLPLAEPGITMFVGPNGSGKTCCLDGIKVLLGVSDLGGTRTPAAYVFDGGSSGRPAEQAWLRATFANPVRSGQRYRVFAVAGGGCQDAENVTVVGRVRGDKRSYIVLPGRIVWGRTQSIEADLSELMERHPESHWLNPKQYDKMLDRVGITKALRGVLALPQGETDQLVREPPAGLMRRLLDLTGRQGTLEQFRIAKSKHDQAVIAHSDAVRAYEQQELQFGRLQDKVNRHVEWAKRTESLREIDEFLLPAARYYEVKDILDRLKEDIAEAERAADTATAEADKFLAGCEADEQKIAGLKGKLLDEELRVERLRMLASRAAEAEGRAHERASEAWRKLEGTRSNLAGVTLTDAEALADARETEFAEAYHRAAEAALECAHNEGERHQLAEGGSLAPRDVREFCVLLRSRNLTPTIVGDALAAATTINETSVALRVQAALGDAIWGIAVPAGQYEEACAEAVAARFGWPIVREGEGTPREVLAIDAPDSLGRLLEELDASAGSERRTDELRGEFVRHSVSEDGLRFGPVLSRVAPEHDAIVRIASRELKISQYAQRLTAGRQEYEALSERVAELKAQLASAYATREAARSRGAIRASFRQACYELTGVRAEHREADSEFVSAQKSLDELNRSIATDVANLDAKKGEEKRLRSEAEEKQLRIDRLRRERVDAELEIESVSLPPGFANADIQQLVPVAELKMRRNNLVLDVADGERYPEDARDPVILTQRDSEQARLAEVAELIEGRRKDLDSSVRILEEARDRYKEHIRALVGELKNRFVQICEIARIVGDIRPVPAGDMPEDFGVDVLVSHKLGEAPVSYQVTDHSGGQRTKIAILLLLAAMSLGQTADLLIVDEHQAHLDGTNSEQIVNVMRELATQAQFILSTPSSGRGDEASNWCDLQVAFPPREPGALHSPPLRLMSRMGVDQLEARFDSAQQTLL